MIRILAVGTFLLAMGIAPAADPKLTVKVEEQEPPKDLSDAVRALLDNKAMSVFDDAKLLCTVWACKSLESKATAEEAKAGLKYANLEETTVVGAAKFPEQWIDYRKQKIKPGVYTLRLGLQPMDGDHQGTAPFNDFLLLSPADKDKKPEVVEAKEMHELSAKSVGRKHPGIMLLFPNKKPTDAPAVEAKPKEHWTLNFQIPVTAAGEKANLGFSLVVVGVTMAE